MIFFDLLINAIAQNSEAVKDEVRDRRKTILITYMRMVVNAQGNGTVMTMPHST